MVCRFIENISYLFTDRDMIMPITDVLLLRIWFCKQLTPIDLYTHYFINN